MGRWGGKAISASKMLPLFPFIKITERRFFLSFFDGYLSALTQAVGQPLITPKS
ncbi:hypothetical protein L8106_11977 [Lyngbya sp. PCC 8106]|nr:hypothetical protein L8106_11977 [Lyngbya sp. PCC 8106]